jgi:hypothetical protein
VVSVLHACCSRTGQQSRSNADPGSIDAVSALAYAYGGQQNRWDRMVVPKGISLCDAAEA